MKIHVDAPCLTDRSYANQFTAINILDTLWILVSFVMNINPPPLWPKVLERTLLSEKYTKAMLFAELGSNSPALRCLECLSPCLFLKLLLKLGPQQISCLTHLTSGFSKLSESLSSSGIINWAKEELLLFLLSRTCPLGITLGGLYTGPFLETLKGSFNSSSSSTEVLLLFNMLKIIIKILVVQNDHSMLIPVIWRKQWRVCVV